MNNLSIIKLEENRVRRNYTGGKVLDTIRGKQNPIDTDRPEEWVGSLTLATNPGLAVIENEGLAVITKDGKSISLVDLFSQSPEHYLGKEHFEKHGLNLGFLTKLIDSAIRLHMQAHPTKEFARKHLNSQYGKFECYYILGAREGYDPYIRLGYQGEISREIWKDVVETQDMSKMDALFEKIPVSVGDMVYIPGGVPHAIGEGLLLIEVMEPSDLVVRCEHNREGIIVPPEARNMGKSLDFCLDIFDYTTRSTKQIRDEFFVSPKSLINTDEYSIDELLSSSIACSFEVLKLSAKKTATIPLDNRFLLGVVTSGSCKIVANGEEIEVSYCDNFIIPAGTTEIQIIPNNNEPCDFCLVFPPKN